MLIKPQTYYFGRFNVIAQYSDKTAFINQGLSTSDRLFIRNFYWGFFNIEKVTYDIGDFFTGYLAKYRPLTEEEIADEESHEINIEQAENVITAKSRFFLDIRSGLISYHPVGYKIQRKQFAYNFCKLFNSAHDNFFIDTEIQSIDDRVEILDVVRRLDRILTVSFYLHPSNPKSADWKKVDERLKSLNVSGYREQYFGRHDSHLNIIDDNEFNDKLNMAADGYGNADITGILEGEEKTIHTKDNPTSVKTLHEDEDYNNVFQDLCENIKKLFERFNIYED